MTTKSGLPDVFSQNLPELDIAFLSFEAGNSFVPSLFREPTTQSTKVNTMEQLSLGDSQYSLTHTHATPGGGGEGERWEREEGEMTNI